MTNIVKRELELNKESEETMVFSMMLSLLTITTPYSFSIVKVNQIQCIEMVDKGNNDGGILTITLKGDKSEQIVYGEDNEETWDAAKKWLKDNVINIGDEMSKKDVHRHRDENPGF